MIESCDICGITTPDPYEDFVFHSAQILCLDGTHTEGMLHVCRDCSTTLVGTYQDEKQDDLERLGYPSDRTRTTPSDSHVYPVATTDKGT
jgi:hypothetical protein